MERERSYLDTCTVTIARKSMTLREYINRKSDSEIVKDFKCESKRYVPSLPRRTCKIQPKQKTGVIRTKIFSEEEIKSMSMLNDTVGESLNDSMAKKILREISKTEGGHFAVSDIATAIGETDHRKLSPSFSRISKFLEEIDGKSFSRRMVGREMFLETRKISGNHEQWIDSVYEMYLDWEKIRRRQRKKSKSTEDAASKSTVVIETAGTILGIFDESINKLVEKVKENKDINIKVDVSIKIGFS